MQSHSFRPAACSHHSLYYIPGKKGKSIPARRRELFLLFVGRKTAGFAVKRSESSFFQYHQNLLSIFAPKPLFSSTLHLFGP
jgi:hypothetical protein